MEANVYYNPEKFGLEVVAEIDYSSGNYEFDTRVVWKDKNNIFWMARDGGCSCPTPFENDSMETLERLDISVLESEVQKALVDKYTQMSHSEGMDFLRKVKNLSK